MEAYAYQESALRTINKKLEKSELLVNAALGLSGESGEVADLIKKWKFQGHDLDTEKVAEELGDVCWYIALACFCIGLGLEDVMEMNIDKLKARYPEGFDTNKSLNRKEQGQAKPSVATTQRGVFISHEELEELERLASKGRSIERLIGGEYDE